MIQTTLGVGGMSCEMCEAHINEAVRAAFPEIKKVQSSRKNCTTVILSDALIDQGALRQVIEKQGYDFLSYASAPYEPLGMFAKIKALLS